MSKGLLPMDRNRFTNPVAELDVIKYNINMLASAVSSGGSSVERLTATAVKFIIYQTLAIIEVVDFLRDVSCTDGDLLRLFSARSVYGNVLPLKFNGWLEECRADYPEEWDYILSWLRINYV